MRAAEVGSADAADLAIAGGARLLVVTEDEEAAFWRALCAGSEIEPTIARDGPSAMAVAASGRMDAALVAGRAPALETVERLRRAHPDMPVLLAADAAVLASARAQSCGAAETMTARPTAEVLLRTVRAALAVGYADDSEPPGMLLLGNSPAMARVRELIGRAAPGLTTILIRGETGTGKELVARAIHAASERAGGPLATIHCGALPDALLESELFGYEKGAFTGADQRKLGRVELAQGGTLFLDEIGDVSPVVQVKLLRLLQERTFERLGGRETIRANVRFVAATHRDLDGMVARGEFREDLFYRLNVVPLWLPPLRARKGDVPLLARSFCEAFARQNSRTLTALSDEAVGVLEEQRWPGNVRQLANFVERLVVLHGGRTIEAPDVRRELSGGSPFHSESDASSRSISVARSSAREGAAVVPLDEALRRAERQALTAALHAARGNRSQAARLLGVSRATLYNKLKEHCLP
jgi:two-component system response regulator AtoC